jgi:preprotein translocase subunit SecE
MKKILSFLSEVRSELKKVTWPKRETVINYLGLVISFSLIVSVFVGLLDLGLTKSLEYFISK